MYDKQNELIAATLALVDAGGEASGPFWAYDYDLMQVHCVSCGESATYNALEHSAWMELETAALLVEHDPECPAVRLEAAAKAYRE